VRSDNISILPGRYGAVKEVPDFAFVAQLAFRHLGGGCWRLSHWLEIGADARMLWRGKL
jgi:hypothetical protein